jgi:hypothetical protein
MALDIMDKKIISFGSFFQKEHFTKKSYTA